MERSRRGQHAGPGPLPRIPRQRSRRSWSRAGVIAICLTALTAVLPGGLGSAAQRTAPSLKSLIAQAHKLANQVNTLSEQYDGLRVQLTQARLDERTAITAAARDAAALTAGQAQVGRLAAESYIAGNTDPALQIISSPDPQLVVNRAAIMQQLDQEKGAQVSDLAAAENTARRAQQTAAQQARVVSALARQMRAKAAVIRAKISKLNGAAFKKAMATFTKTGKYPLINMPGANTLGEEALQEALTRQGDPYVWGAAGPGAFDCSGLVEWAYAQVGIHLDHYTGDQWNEGEHVSRHQLQPGDLVFFYSDISHVGIYLGNGLMVDAPDFGQDVMVQPVMWNDYVGAVQIVG